MARQREGCGQQWQLAEVRIITVAGHDVGWLQTTAAEDAIFIGQLYLEGASNDKGSVVVSSERLSTKRRGSVRPSPSAW